MSAYGRRAEERNNISVVGRQTPATKRPGPKNRRKMHDEKEGKYNKTVHEGRVYEGRKEGRKVVPRWGSAAGASREGGVFR